MTGRGEVAGAAAALLGVFLWAQAVALPAHAASVLPPRPAAPASPTPPEGSKAGAAAERVYDAKQLTREQFDRLQDTAVIDVRGARFTARDLRAKARRNAQALQERLRAVRGKAQAQAAAFRATFLQEEKTRLEAENAQRRAGFGRLHALRVANPSLAGALAAAVANLAPQITATPASVKPGSFVFVEGQHFGDEQGTVLLKGLPGGDQALPFDGSYLFPWMDTGIAVVIPQGTAIYDDQQVTLQVVRKDGKASAGKTVQFQSPHEVVALQPAVLEKCDDNDTYHTCEPNAMTFFGAHTEDTFWETDGIGCDKWKVNLKNGWVFHSLAYYDWSNGGGSVGNPGQPIAGGTSWGWQVCWTVPGSGPIRAIPPRTWASFTSRDPRAPHGSERRVRGGPCAWN